MKQAFMPRPALIFLIGAAAFALFVSANFVSFPVGDDFKAIFPMAMEAGRQGWSSVTFENLAAQHFSHRIVGVRLFAALQTIIFGSVNLTLFMWLGLLMWVAAFVLLANREGWLGAWASAAAGALVWFQPQAAWNLMVSMQSVQNIGVVLLTFVAFAFRLRATPLAVSFAYLCAILAWFTAGNGLLALIILIAWDFAERRWIASGIGALLLLVAGWFYFHGFRNPESQTYGFNVVELVGNALVMLGSVFRVGTAPLSVALAGGALLTCGGLLMLWQRSRKKDFFGVACIIFVFGSVAMASIARLGWGMEYMAQGRYRVYAIILLALILGRILSCIRGQPVMRMGVVVLALMFAAVSWWQYAPEVINARLQAEACALSYHLRESAVFAEHDEFVHESLGLLSAAVAAGLYKPPLAEEAERLRAEAGRMLAVESVICDYARAVAGFVVESRENIQSRYLLCQETGRAGFRVAVRPVQRVALGRLLRGQWPPATSSSFVMPVSIAGCRASSGLRFTCVGD